MNLDIKKAFYSPFSDSKWKSKLFILSLFSIFSVFQYFLTTIQPPTFSMLFFLLILLPIPPLFIFAGYCLQFGHNAIHNISPLLANWKSNFFKYFKHGLFSLIVFFIYAIPLIMILYIISPEKQATTLYYLIDLSSKMHILKFLGFHIIYLIFFLIIFLLITLNIAILFSADCLYMDNFKISNAFAVRKLFKFIFDAKYELFLIIVISTILNFISEIAKHLLSSSLIISIVPAFIISLQCLIINNLLGQTYYLYSVSELKGFLNEIR